MKKTIKRLFSAVISGVFAASTVFPAFAELDGNRVEPWERSAETHRENLKNSISYLSEMDISAYTDASVNELKAAIEKASEKYADETLTAKQYWSARNELEYARAKLVYANIEPDGGYRQPFRELSAEELINEMGAGINLGNTLDGHNSQNPGETAWQPLPVTKELIRSMHDAGYNTLRVPVTWGKKIKKNGDAYTIDEAWLNRVQEIVDYALSQGMYVVINIHHDGVNWSSGWFNIGNNDIDAVMEKYAAVWHIIAERFRDYDEHLIFESMNEMTCAQTDGKMWEGGAFEYDVDVIRNFNQLFVNEVRATGSNNTKRRLASKGHFAYTGLVTMPVDPLNDGVSCQMYSAHIYNSVKNRYNGIKEFADNYRSLGCPLILGEWTTYTGDDGSTETGYNDVQKAFQSEMVYEYARVNGICAVAWDIGVFEKNGRIEGGNASYWSRADMKPGFQSQLRGVMRGAYSALSEDNKSGDLSSVYAQYGLDPAKGVDQNPKTVTETKITEISCESSLEMSAGEIKIISPTVSPSDTNDILVWTTSDDSVAAVSNGRITAKKAGTAVITAYALNTVEYGWYGHYNADPYKDAVKKEITVTVKNTDSSAEISANESIGLPVNSSALLDVSCGELLSFSSDNEEAVTVNEVGRVFAKGVGTANIKITAANGKSKNVKAAVTGASDSDSPEYVNVGIFVLYNDAKHSYWENEIGETVKIAKNSTYTLTYDIAKHQSDEAKAAGIDTINYLTAIYLKDVDVHSGAIEKSAFRHCRLKWEKVEINGQEMELNEDGRALNKPINKNGVFDSGKPVNSWEGNDIEGVAVSDHTAVFTDIENPTSVTLTFTISQIMLNSIPTAEYVKTALVQAESLDISQLSDDEAKEFTENVEKLKELNADETTPELKLLNCYAKVKAVIDNVKALTMEQEQPEEASSETSAGTEEESEAAVSGPSAPEKTEKTDNTAAVIIIIASAAIVTATAIIVTAHRGRKKKGGN